MRYLHRWLRAASRRSRFCARGKPRLIRRVKYYERTVARGIVNRSKRDIVESLAMHPLVNSYSLAKDIAAQYFELNRDYIDGWTD